MNGIINYCNTDLVIITTDDITPLAAAFEARGVRPLYGVTKGDDGQSYVTFETAEHFSEPEPNIGAMLAVIEALEPDLRSDWLRCSLREFNIGYDCGLEPWAFNQGLSAELLGRIAAVHASLRVTLYPYRAQDDADVGEK